MHLPHLSWLKLVVALGLALGAASCSTEERRPNRGTFVDDVAPRRPVAPVAPWRHASDVASLTVVREHQKSAHFLGAPEVEIRVNELAAGYGRRGGELVEGSLIVATHALPDGIVRFAMEKRAGADPKNPTVVAWEYSVIDAAFRAVERGRIATCVRCHEEAATDEVFGPPGL